MRITPLPASWLAGACQVASKGVKVIEGERAESNGYAGRKDDGWHGDLYVGHSLVDQSRLEPDARDIGNPNGPSCAGRRGRMAADGIDR